MIDFPPACISLGETLPWMPADTPGKSSKLLRVLPDDAGFVELLRMDPGVVMPLHRHTGAIHAYNLQGMRQLCTGEIIGPGDYVYEPPGNVDHWKIIGNAPMIAFVVVMGEVEFIRADGEVLARANAATQRRQYVEFCAAHAHLDMQQLDATPDHAIP